SGDAPPFAPGSTELIAAMRDFELTYAEYNEFQRRMERYWCVRWLRQNAIQTAEALVLRDNLVRFTDIPFIFKVPSLPPQLPGSKISLAITGSDLIDIDVEARYLATLAEPDPETQEETAY
ncbi:MAG: RNB domain-containing ribonuclease, partial [Zoogloeaceae bacterium]|nr:RNB domain-containing ribonuclease [Zoogloeaceae bacterium]